MSDNCSFGRLHHCIELRDLGFIFAEHLHRQAVESMECADITPQTPLFEIFIIARVEDKPSQWLPLNTGFVTPRQTTELSFRLNADAANGSQGRPSPNSWQDMSQQRRPASLQMNRRASSKSALGGQRSHRPGPWLR